MGVLLLIGETTGSWFGSSRLFVIGFELESAGTGSLYRRGYYNLIEREKLLLKEEGMDRILDNAVGIYGIK